MEKIFKETMILCRVYEVVKNVRKTRKINGWYFSAEGFKLNLNLSSESNEEDSNNEAILREK